MPPTAHRLFSRMSSALPDLADAAAEEAPQAPLPEPVVQQVVGEKRKRCGKVETAQKKAHKVQNDLSLAAWQGWSCCRTCPAR